MTENPMIAAPTHPADAISGEPTADANVQAFSSSGANKQGRVSTSLLQMSAPQNVSDRCTCFYLFSS